MSDVYNRVSTWTPIDERWMIVNKKHVSHHVLFTGSPKTACGRRVEREPVEDKMSYLERCGHCEALFTRAQD